MARSELVEARVTKLIKGFAGYVQAYDDRVPFTGEQLASHRRTVRLRQQAADVRAAINDPQFITSLRQTLFAWGVGRRASRLVQEDQFVAALQAALPDLELLEPLALDAPSLPSDLVERLWLLINSLGVVTNKAKLVAGTKTLHHLLPDLVPPMDRAWTGFFFRFHLPEWQDTASQRRIFHVAYNQFAAIAQRVQPQQYATGSGWRTSRTKILDNALIGFCKLELGSGRLVVEEATGNQIAFEVKGYPPAKGEAISMLGARHAHAPRVRLLLEAAQQACIAHDFSPVAVGAIALDVILSSPAGANRTDATNYLGGIADVLEDKSRRGSLDHLGELASVWLYRNDFQIKEVGYREVEADEPGYVISIRQVEGPGGRAM